MNALMLGAEMTSSGRLFQSFTIRCAREWALISVPALFLGSSKLWPRVVEFFTGDRKLGRVGSYTLCCSLYASIMSPLNRLYRSVGRRILPSRSW